MGQCLLPLGFVLIPQPFIPLLEFVTGDFSILSGSIEAGVTELPLKKPQTIAGIVDSHGMSSEGIPQPVRANVILLARLRVNQPGQARSCGAIPDYLPGSMSIDTKD